MKKNKDDRASEAGGIISNRLAKIELIHGPLTDAQQISANCQLLIAALLWLPQSDHVLLGVHDPGKRSRWDGHWAHDFLATQRFGFSDSLRDVVHLHVEHGVVVRLVAQGHQMPG